MLARPKSAQSFKSFARLACLAVLVGAPMSTVGDVAAARPVSTAAVPTDDDTAAPPTRERTAPDRSRRPAAPDRTVLRQGRGDASDPMPPIAVEPRTIDVGFFPPKTNKKATVQLRNTGDKPITIAAVQPSCKCTTIGDLVGTVIEPGQSVPMEAQLDGGSAPGIKRASIKVLFDGYTRVIEIPIKGEVAHQIRAVPGYINAMSGRGSGEQGRLVLESVDGVPFTICSVHGKPPKLVGFDPASDAPRSQYVLEYDLAAFADAGIPMFLLIETDRADCPLLDVRVRHDAVRVTPGIRGSRDLGVGAGLIEQGGSGTVELDFTKASGLEITSVSSPNGDAAFEIVEQEEGDDGTVTLVVKVTPKADFTGILYTPMLLDSNRGDQKTVVFAKVVPAGSSGCGTAPGEAASKAAAPAGADSAKGSG